MNTNEEKETLKTHIQTLLDTYLISIQDLKEITMELIPDEVIINTVIKSPVFETMGDLSDIPNMPTPFFSMGNNVLYENEHYNDDIENNPKFIGSKVQFTIYPEKGNDFSYYLENGVIKQENQLILFGIDMGGQDVQIGE